MSRIQTITSLQNPRVKAVAKLRDAKGRRAAGVFVAEGRREVERAIQAGLAVRELWLSPDKLGIDEDQTAALADSLIQDLPLQPSLTQVPAQVFEKLAYVRDPEGILAVCEPPIWTVDDIVSRSAGGLDLVAVGTEKPGNLGAMVRTADAAGCRSVIAAGAPVDAMNPNAIRSSTGAVFHMPTLAMSEAKSIDHLLSQGTRIIAAYPEDAIDYTQIDYAGPVAIAIGPEDRGLDDNWRNAAEQSGGACVRIPMASTIADSLNASVAAAVLLFEAVRQRRASDLQ